MRRLAWLWMLWLAVGCAETSEPSLMGNTNWLSVCVDSDDCDTDQTCICGVCSASCEDDNVCGEQGGGLCTELSDVASCGGPAPMPRACLSECDRDAACGSDGVCDMDAERCVGAKSGGDEPTMGLPSLVREDALVPVPDAYRHCEVHSDCIAVANGCDGCCQAEGIHRDTRGTFDTNFLEACRDWTGGICDCAPADRFPRCVGQLCTMVPREEIADCYSPEQNYERAYDEGAIGCPCGTEGASVCVPPASLSCGFVSGSGARAWQSAEDGACEIAGQGCGDNPVTASVNECLALSQVCFVLEGGDFCAWSQ